MEPLTPVVAVAQDLRRKVVRVKDGAAICPLPSEHVIVGCELLNGNLSVDYLAALDAECDVERPFRVLRARNAAKLSRTGGVGFALPDVQTVLELGGGWYAFGMAPRAVPRATSSVPAEPDDAVAHEQPADPSKNGATEGGA